MQAETKLFVDRRTAGGKLTAIDWARAEFLSIAGPQAGPGGWIEVYDERVISAKLPGGVSGWVVTIEWGC